jgi:hypothetical protein
MRFALAFLCGFPAAANLISNGSFEPGAYTSAALSNGSTAILDWTVTSPGSANVAWLQNGDYGLRTPFGTQFLDLTGYTDAAPYAGVSRASQLHPELPIRLRTICWWINPTRNTMFSGDQRFGGVHQRNVFELQSRGYGQPIRDL